MREPRVVAAVVAAHNEVDRIAETVGALREQFAGLLVVVGDDGSTDATASVARTAGAEVVETGRNIGKGGAMTVAATRALDLLLAQADGEADNVERDVILLCDGDLAGSAGTLPDLARPVLLAEADIAVADFARRVGGGFGLALGFARWAIRRRCGFTANAPISGQRALSVGALRQVLPFAPRFGMEIGMTVDGVRAGLRVTEVELDLSHRATGKSLAGFLHRGRQLIDFVRVYLSRRA